MTAMQYWIQVVKHGASQPRSDPLAKRKYALGRQPHWDRICWMEQSEPLVTAS